MKEYKIETHLHTEESNHCSEVPAYDMVRLYKDEGYDVVIVTPHYSRPYLTVIHNDWDARIDYILTGYKNAKKCGEEIGIKILLGLELTLVENKSDYLIYGMDEEFLRANPALYKLTLDELVEICKTNNFLMVQAHPFRRGIELAPLKYQMAIEIFNGRHVLDAKNSEAEEYAKKHNLIGLSGTDFHDFYDHRSGISTNKEINNIEDFKEVIKSRNFKNIIPN